MIISSRVAGYLLPFLFLPSAPITAQLPDTSQGPFGGVTELVMIGGDLDDRRRVSQLFGETPPDRTLIRSPSILGPAIPGTGLRFQAISPTVGGIWSSDIPFNVDDGPLWAGRGVTAQLVAGMRAAWGPLALTLAPRAAFTENADFLLLPEMERAETFLPPWRGGQQSLDLPLRFGRGSSTRISWGESSLALAAGPVTAGIGTESQWWGPGIRNAIVLSDNAPGIPHLFLRPTRPVRTLAGTFEANWLLGQLAESPYFDTIATNDHRSLSGLAITLRPAWEANLAVGISHVVYSPIKDSGALPGRFFDVLTRWNNGTDDAEERGDSRPWEQILSLFGRWVFPNDGLEVYGEWAHHELPGSFRDFLIQPNHTQGYTLGLQWARVVRGDGTLRLQSELTYLEQSATYRARPHNTFYASETVPQGYTHLGQTVGAAIGPGASSQWLAGDYLQPDWRLGVFAGRVRWDNDAYYGRLAPWPFLGHDVSVFGGIRGSYHFSGMRVDAEFTTGSRLNFLFQNRAKSWETAADSAVNADNRTLRLTLVPFAFRTRKEQVAVPPVPRPPPPVARPSGNAPIARTPLADAPEGDHGYIADCEDRRVAPEAHVRPNRTPCSPLRISPGTSAPDSSPW